MTDVSEMTLSQLKNVPATREQRMPAITPGFGDLQSFELMQRIAKMFSASPLVPKIYEGPEGLPSCVIALNMAMRMNADPLMVMQNLYVVHGKPGWSAQFLIACFNQCGRFSAIRYRWQGQQGKVDWGCRAYATELRSNEEILGPLVTIQTAKDEAWIDRTGSKWKTIPELMLTYRAASWMIRTHAPEIAMGLPTVDELGDTFDSTATREPVDVAALAVGSNGNGGSTQNKTFTASFPDPQKGAAPAAPAVQDAEMIDKKTGEVTAATGATATNDLLAIVVKYAEVADKINKATNSDELNDARALIQHVKNEKHRVELSDLAKVRQLQPSFKG